MHHPDNVSALTSGLKLWTLCPNVRVTNEPGFVIEVAKLHICFGETNKSGVQFTHVTTLHVRPRRLESAEKSQPNGNYGDYARKRATLTLFPTFLCYTAALTCY